MGGKSGNDSNVGKKTEQMAQQYFNETQPLRSSLVGNYQNFLGGPAPQQPSGGQGPAPQQSFGVQGFDKLMPTFMGPNGGANVPGDVGGANVPGDVGGAPAGGLAYDVTRNPVWGAGRNVIENQYDVARQNTLSNMPKGGALVDTMSDVDQGRAQALGGLASQVSQDEYNKAYGMATGAPGQAMSTMSSLAGSEAMANAQQSAGKMGALGDLGLGAGTYFGSKK